MKKNIYHYLQKINSCTIYYTIKQTTKRMHFMKSLLLLLLSLLLVIGCAKAKPQFGNIKAGDAESTVIAKLGKPSSTALSGAVKYLEYESWDYNPWYGYRENYQVYFVKIVDGKVESFGRKGDFDSTKDPTQRIIIKEEKENNGNSKSPVKKSLSEKIKELDKLKSDGVITDEEYKSMRKKVIDAGD